MGKTRIVITEVKEGMETLSQRKHFHLLDRSKKTEKENRMLDGGDDEEVRPKRKL